MSNRTNSMKSIRLAISLIVMTLSGIVYADRAGEVKLNNSQCITNLLANLMTFADSGHVAQSFRSMPHSDSAPCRTVRRGETLVEYIVP
jgi:hypothetical protein